ncbi:MAG: flagellin-like protein [Magnetovibrio sp.]|nr:flagellin-like protein [Magnetovibrio sp.]|tara:strand:+ start:3380 stop:4687 length:1308 start_codon:yes stop_codon:yes gene_type:complete
MSDVSLTAAVRQNLLSLQNTTDLINRTQNRLSTGLRVANAIDDPVKFFQAKGLQDRASDFEEKKTGIDQGISTLSTATDAIVAIENLVQQLKGLATNAKSATTDAEVANIITQFNDLRTQINNLTTDATYQGLNLVAGTGSVLEVNFSNDTGSVLTVNSIDVTVKTNGLDIAQLTQGTQSINFNQAFISGGTLSGEGNLLASAGGGLDAANPVHDTITVSVGGQTTTIISAGDTFTLAYDGITFTVDVYTSKTAAGNLSASYVTAGTYAIGTTIEFAVVTGMISGQSGGSGFSAQTAGTGLSAGINRFSVLGSGGMGVFKLTGTSLQVTETDAKRTIGIGFTTELNGRITNLDSALTTLRSRTQTLGANVAVLQTRLDFTKDYVNTMTAGAGKLTLADLNEEGANLLALQTRQQLGIQSLAFAGQSEQSILGLFR